MSLLHICYTTCVVTLPALQTPKYNMCFVTKSRLIHSYVLYYNSPVDTCPAEQNE